MRTMTSYRSNKVSCKVKYHCTCGHKFTRVNSDEFTMSRFNKLSYKDSLDITFEQVKNKKRYCPKCKTICEPLIK